MAPGQDFSLQRPPALFTHSWRWPLGVPFSSAWLKNIVQRERTRSCPHPSIDDDAVVRTQGLKQGHGLPVLAETSSRGRMEQGSPFRVVAARFPTEDSWTVSSPALGHHVGHPLWGQGTWDRDLGGEAMSTVLSRKNWVCAVHRGTASRGRGGTICQRREALSSTPDSETVTSNAQASALWGQPRNERKAAPPPGSKKPISSFSSNRRGLQPDLPVHPPVLTLILGGASQDP